MSHRFQRLTLRTAMKLFLNLITAAYLTPPVFGASTLNSDSVAALAFWSFQTDSNDNTFQSGISRQKGFQGIPTLEFVGSALQAASGTNNGREFTFDDHVYGGGTDTRAIAWQHTGTNAWTNDKSFTLTLNTTGFYDLNIRFDARTAANPSPHSQAPSSYTITYSIDGGENWVPIPLSAAWAADAGYHEIALNLSSFADLNNREDVRIRFALDNGPETAPSVATTRNVRVDNFLVTAVPEASTAVFGMLSALGLLTVRRRAGI